MTEEHWIDQAEVGLKHHVQRHRHRSAGGMSLDIWQVAGVVLLSIYVSPALITGTSQDWADSVRATLLSSPLLAWLFTPLRRSDDLFDELTRRRAEFIDMLAVIVIWTWPVTCCAPLVAVARWIQMFQIRGS